MSSYAGSALGRRRRGGVRVRRLRRWRRRLPALSTLLVVGVAGTVLALSVETAELLADSEWLRVQGVTVSGQRQLDLRCVLEWLGPVEGQPLLDVDPLALAARLARHPRIAAAELSRGLDRRLHVAIEERQPVALVLDEGLVEVDATGIVLPPIAGLPLPDLPVVTGLAAAGPPVPGVQLRGRGLERVLALLDDLAGREPALLMRLAEIDLSEEPILRLRLTGSEVVICAHAGSLTPEKLDGLHSILANLEQRGRSRVEIDLRFEGQLVVRGLPGSESPTGQEGGL